MANPQATAGDPPAGDFHGIYKRCENHCTHDLAKGVLIDELIGGEGPWPDSNPLMSTESIAARVLRAFGAPQE